MQSENSSPIPPPQPEGPFADSHRQAANGLGAQRKDALLRVIAALFILASVVTLGIALTRPTVFFKGARGPEEIYSIYGGVKSLWQDGNLTSATIVFVFSIVFPAGKLLFLAWLCPRHRIGGVSQRVLRVLTIIGKWSLVDVFIIALFVGSLLPVFYARSASRSGIHTFALAIFLSMIAARLVSRLFHVGGSRQPMRAGVGFRVRGALSLVSLVLLGVALSEFYYRIRPPSLLGAFTKDEIALLPSIGHLWNEGEVRMAIYVALFIVSVPLIRGLLGVLLAFVRRSWVRRWANRMDEWAMLDVFILALALVYDKLSELTNTSLQSGFWWLLAAGLVAELDAFLIRADRAVGRPTPEPSSS